MSLLIKDNQNGQYARSHCRTCVFHAFTREDGFHAEHPQRHKLAMMYGFHAEHQRRKVAIV
ncbi:hypothetical protein J6590_089776 [Homalodisca vitripennis]|nr:hypothetical protein J6590_089776 [Homalodisca vitripennis]